MMISAFPFSSSSVFIIHFFAENEHDDVGVLLDGAGFTQIGKLRAVVAAALLGRARELRKRDERHIELFGNAL